MLCPCHVGKAKTFFRSFLLFLGLLFLFGGCSKPEDNTPQLPVYYLWDGNMNHAGLTLQDMHRTMREGNCKFAYDGETLQLANYTLNVKEEGDDLIIEKVCNNQYPGISINTDLFISSVRAMQWDCGGQ